MGKSKDEIKAAIEEQKKALDAKKRKLNARLQALYAKENAALNRERNHVLILLGAQILLSEKAETFTETLISRMKPKDAEKVREYFKKAPIVKK